ncbi:MAG: hypothetical protein OQK04_03350 [Kangiellaceae bacterium]|nr:hypothetical protein [Kangiellaceae bacterium]MCW8997742.1 hypothetical protein [Kangiellaceae bacterium]
MNVFLKMKSWQVFGLIFGLPFVFQSLLMSRIMSSNTIEPKEIFGILSYMMLGFMAIFMTWFWGLGTGLNNIVKPEIRPSSKLFKFGIIYSASYMILFMLFMTRFVEQEELGSMMGVIFPLHLFAMFCMFYGLHFIAKNLVMAEKNEAVKFGEFSGPFFLIWFFPIGIWFVQPRINKLISNNDT